MAAAIVRNHAIAVTEEKHNLRVPVVGRERPAVTEHDWATSSPVFIVDFRAVFGRNKTHRRVSCGAGEGWGIALGARYGGNRCGSQAGGYRQERTARWRHRGGSNVVHEHNDSRLPQWALERIRRISRRFSMLPGSRVAAALC